MTKQLDRTDTKRALAVHQSGDVYAVEYCSVWEDGQCVGDQVLGVIGPLADTERPDVQEVGLQGLYDWLDAIPDGNFEAEDADWMQAEEDAGRVAYPYGAR